MENENLKSPLEKTQTDEEKEKSFKAVETVEIAQKEKVVEVESKEVGGEENPTVNQPTNNCDKEKTRRDRRELKKIQENAEGADEALMNLVNTPIQQFPQSLKKSVRGKKVEKAAVKEKINSSHPVVVRDCIKNPSVNAPIPTKKEHLQNTVPTVTPKTALPTSTTLISNQQIAVSKSPTIDQRTLLVEIPSDAVGRVDQNIDNQPYYHGFMGREECAAMLQNNGDFLVRQTEIGKHVCYVISLKWTTATNHHILVRKTRTKKLYWVKDYAFKSICELIAYHKINRIPVYENMLLICGIGRQTWQLNHEQVVLKDKLGEGQFGEVYRGTLRTSIFSAPFTVAVKTLIQDHLSANEKILFLREANVMLTLLHPNVIRFHGVCTMKNPIMIVMEFCEGKSLEDSLHAKQVTDELKITYLYHAICGIDYLHGKHVLHRDIAARNCLLTGNQVLKISDFGLSVKGVAIKERKGGKLPVKYMAPETLKKGFYSTSSDIYSYSALIYEVYHEGGIPFENSSLAGNVLRKAIINQKISLELTTDSPPFIQEIFNGSRKYDPEERLKAKEMKEIFKREANVQEVSKTIREQIDEFSESMRKRLRKIGKKKNGSNSNETGSREETRTDVPVAS